MQDREGLRKEATFFDRRELGVKLNAFMVVKSDIFINESLCIMDGLRLVKTNAFRFENGKEIIITNDDVISFENEVINLIESPEKLSKISQNGRSKFLEIYSNEYQMNPRIELLVNEIESK